MKGAVNNMNVPNNQKVVFGIHQVTQPDLQVIIGKPYPNDEAMSEPSLCEDKYYNIVEHLASLKLSVEDSSNLSAYQAKRYFKLLITYRIVSFKHRGAKKHGSLSITFQNEERIQFHRRALGKVTKLIQGRRDVISLYNLSALGSLQKNT